MVGLLGNVWYSCVKVTAKVNSVDINPFRPKTASYNLKVL